MIWSRPANPAAFDATDRNAATGTGEPSYVSGAQKWNGTADTLKPNPTMISKIAPSLWFTDNALDEMRRTQFGVEWPARRVLSVLIDEQVHHGAEIALLRDLYRHRAT